MRVLVTGGTGFIGSNLASALLGRGDDVLITGREDEKEATDPYFENVGYDFSGLDWEGIGKIDALFHQAAINDTTLMDREEMFSVNFYGTQKLFRDAVSAGCRRIVYASSTAVYGNGPTPYREGQKLEPLNPYAESKALLDGWASEFAKEKPEVTVVGLRYCNVYGPGESRKGKRATMIYQLAQQMRAGNPRLFEWGEHKRDYIYIKDVVRANLLAAETKEGGIYNCAHGKATSFNEIVEILNSVLGTSRAPEYFDNPYEGKYQNCTECDMSLARERIGFTPEYDVEKGIRDYYEGGFLV